MTLTIGDDRMTSDRSAHAGRLLPGARHTWEVSWLPGRHLDHRRAVTAMTIADTTADGTIRPDNEQWLNIKNWAAELDLTRSEALHRVTAPPQWDRHPVTIYEFPEVNGIRLAIEDPDPIDLGIADEYFDDWPYPGSPDLDPAEDDPIDPTWTGTEPPELAPPRPGQSSLEAEDPRAIGSGGAGSDLWLPVPRQRSTQDVSWPDARVPHQGVSPENTGRSLLPAPEPRKQDQPAAEPDSDLDWEPGE